MIMIDKLPFKFVEYEGFRKYSHNLYSTFTIPSSVEVAADCFKLFVEERKKLKSLIKGRRLCLSIGIWSCVYGFNYMCLTTHWIDDGWKWERRILKFHQIHDCSGKTIGEEIELCLLEWGVDRILTLTLHDGSSNDLLTGKWKSTSIILENEFLHVRSYGV